MIPPHPHKVGINRWLNTYAKWSLEENTVRFENVLKEKQVHISWNHDRYRGFWIKFNWILTIWIYNLLRNHLFDANCLVCGIFWPSLIFPLTTRIFISTLIKGEQGREDENAIILMFLESKLSFSLHFTESSLLPLAWVYTNSTSLKQWFPWAIRSRFLVCLLFPFRLDKWELTVL